MLISKVPENNEGRQEEAAVSEEEGDLHEYQTANELFEIMAKNQNFDNSDGDRLTTRDLVLLYKNIDLGAKLMSSANELKAKKPNQYVETIVYNDEAESEGSDISDIYSNEDLRNVFLVNNERLDLINTPPSVDNTLCQKLGDLQIQTSNLTTEYDKHFLLRDPYIKEQLKKLKLVNKNNVQDTILPTSLLDYICCKRLEDNYNFYMDNIIRHVKHTIDQLKRISNGDYLTDRAKERWREVDTTTDDRLHVNTKILATSTSIPLHVEQKTSGRNTTWDDIVHSAVDVRSLSKILEKKIIVEVPKLLCGPYKLLSKCCAENVIIRCKNDKRPVEERVDVVVQLQRSEAGQVISKISSIMILQGAPVNQDTLGPDVLPLPLPYKEQINDKQSTENKSKIIELEPISIDDVHEVSINSESSEHSSNTPFEYSFLDGIELESSDNDISASLKDGQVSSESSDALKDILDKKLEVAQSEVYSEVFTDDLRVTIRKLTMQSALPEESGEDMSSTSKKKKSPTRVRIKSPYENQSHAMEEKKRRRLLEIRERREKKKMALAENCKITKHKYPKGAPLPQSASSVTKLSISNKSFYNSIYGQTVNGDPNKHVKGRNQKGVKRDILEINMEDEEENDVSVSTPEKDSKKYINRSYYLDDAVTEMMYMNMKGSDNDAKDQCSTSTSVMSNEYRNNLNYLSQLIGPSETDFNIDDEDIFPDKIKILDVTQVDDSSPKDLHTSQSKLKLTTNSPNPDDQDNTGPMEPTSTVECRKSIEKIFTLMNKLEMAPEIESKLTNSKSKEVPTNSTCQGSESGTSLKHRITSSNPSSFSFEKNNAEKPNQSPNKKTESLSPVIPKVIISSKSFAKTDSEKNRRKERKSPITKVTENPLKALSQLLHEFDNIQKARPKTNNQQKHVKKIDTIGSDGKSGSRQSHKRPSRHEQQNDVQIEKIVRVPTPKDKKSKQLKEIDIVTKVPYQQIPGDDNKHADKLSKKKITDIMDEAKEARGEAVRGPSKLNSRLNSLAQPKKIYVQAHSEEFQTKRFTKPSMAHRLQRLATTPTLGSDRTTANTRNKVKRSGSEATPAVGAMKPQSPLPSSHVPTSRTPVSTVPPSERALRTHQSANSSPEAKERLNQVIGSSYKQISVSPETPQTLKKKMVAVESYVKNHYGSATPSSLVNGEPLSVQKSRVPLLPNDIELESSTSSAPFQESAELGNRLHNIISSIMKTTTQGLEVLTECHENTSLADNGSCAEHPSSDSDYPLDVLDDNNVITSVENIATKREQMLTILPEPENTDDSHNDLHPVKSTGELEKLENALCNHVPAGNFQKRLRIKNLTMTPKQSLQQVFVLQSGDASSLVVQSPITQNLNKKDTKKITDLTALPILSKSHLDWRFASMPMQISTIGYAFPDRSPVKRGSASLVQLFDEVPKNPEGEKFVHTGHKSKKNNRSSQRAQPQLCFEQTVQVDVPSLHKLVTVGINNIQTPALESDKKQEIKQDVAIKTETEHKIIDFNKDKRNSKNKDSVENTNGEHTVNQTNIEKKDKVSVEDKPQNIEYSASLDILVGLLNEIQNITTCQTQMTKGDNAPSGNQESKALETILINEAAALENSMKDSPCEVISFTSLEKLRQLESNPSVYSFYLSDNEGSVPTEIIPMYANKLCCHKRMYVDKEVGEDLIPKDAVNSSTDVPSQIFSPGTSNSANMTSSLIHVLSQPAVQSMISFGECPSEHSNAASLDRNSIKNIPQIIITQECKQSLNVFEVHDEIIESPIENKPHAVVIESFEKKKVKKRRRINNGDFRFKTDFDPIMKMKRDVLVTVYSILVLTVFAALSFPEMLYRI